MRNFIFIIFILYSTKIYCIDLPYSFTESSGEIKSKVSIDLIVTGIPDIKRLLAYEDSLNLISPSPLNYYGYEYKFELNINSVGTWENLANGDRLWRYHIVCPNAFSVNFVFENMDLAENSSLSFYNENNESLIGPLNSRINRKHGVFSSHTIDGQSVFIELYEPLKDYNKNQFTLSKIVYGYKEIPTPQPLPKLLQFQSSHSCNEDVNCSEGDDFCREKYSVAVVVSKVQNPDDSLWHFASGALINNTALDYKPYFLTAEHVTPLQSILDQWAFKFGYMTESCNSSTFRLTKVYSGADFIASWGQQILL